MDTHSSVIDAYIHHAVIAPLKGIHIGLPSQGLLTKKRGRASLSVDKESVDTNGARFNYERALIREQARDIIHVFAGNYYTTIIGSVDPQRKTVVLYTNEDSLVKLFVRRLERIMSQDAYFTKIKIVNDGYSNRVSNEALLGNYKDTTVGEEPLPEDMDEDEEDWDE